MQTQKLDTALIRWGDSANEYLWQAKFTISLVISKDAFEHNRELTPALYFQTLMNEVAAAIPFVSISHLGMDPLCCVISRGEVIHPLNLEA